MKWNKIVSLILAVIMMLSCVSVVMAATPPASVHVSARNDAPAITIDGVVSESEWGNPIGSWNIDQVRANTNWTVWTFVPAQENQRIELYVRRDTAGIYLAFRMVNAHHLDYGYTGSNGWMYANVKFALGAYHAQTNIDNGEYQGASYEKWLSYVLRQRWDAAANAFVAESVANGQGKSSYKNPENFSIGWDEASKTYTYEIALPYADLDGYITADTPEIALAFEMTDAFVDNGCGNRWFISQAISQATESYNTAAFLDYNPLRITFSDFYVSNAATPMPAIAPTIDGSVSENEWGKPVIVTNPAHAASSWANGYWGSEPTKVNNDQRAKVWLTNDKTYMYVAVTLDKEAVGTAWTGAQDWCYPKMGLMLAAAGEDGDIQQFEYEGAQHDRWNSWSFTFDADGNGVGATSLQHGTAQYYGLSSDDYSVTFNSETGTYVYEMRIPYQSTNIDLSNSNQIVMSVHIGASNYGTNTASNENNRYNIGGLGWAGQWGSNTPYRDGNCLSMTLNAIDAENTYIGSTAGIPGEVTIDGNVTDGEYGNALAVVSPTTAGVNYFGDDTENIRSDQRAKLWLSNDDKYIYVAATLDRSSRGEILDKDAVYDGWKYPWLIFTVGPWDDVNTMKQFIYDNKNYECLTKYSLMLTDEGPHIISDSKGIDNPALDAADYTVVYDEATKTYTYEMRIPISKTHIDLEQSQTVAMSAQIGTSLYNAAGVNNRYNLAVGATNYPYQSEAHWGGRALKVTLNKPDAGLLGTYVKDTVTEKKGDITIDANVSTEEWGEPVIVTSPKHAVATWGVNGFWAHEAADDTQRAKVYATNDGSYMYFAVTLDKSEAGIHTAMWKAPQLGFTLARYDAVANVPHITYQGTEYEQFSFFRIGWDNGVPTLVTDALGIDMSRVQLSEEDWAIKYDAAAKTYTYEIRVPFTATNISLHETTQIAMSVNLGASNLGTAESTENNRYNIGGTGAAYQYQADAGNIFPHKDQPALVLNLRQQYYVSTQVSAIPENLTIDGKISIAEWGNPIIVTNPAHTRSDVGAFWDFDPAATDNSQTARMWMTNDGEYIYIGATLDKSAYNSATTNAAGAELMNYMRPHLLIDIARYNAVNTVPHIVYNGGEYEQYTGFMLWLDNDGKKCISARTLGIDAWLPGDEDYAIVYDAATATYTYELRIPLSKTNIDLYETLDAVFSASIGTTYSGVGEQSNRYNFSTGHTGGRSAGDFPHKNNALSVKLNDATIKIDTYVKDTVAKFSGNVAIDGRVSAEEWGEPIIVTTPEHCQATWGNFWEFDPSTVVPYQTATIYATNDDNYVYFAATLNETDFDDAQGKAYEKAHFFITIGRYDEQTDMERIRSNGQMYERFVMYSMGFDGSMPNVSVRGNKVDRVSINEDDWAIRYDAQTRTYSYEIRIPYEKTTLRYGNDNKMNVCFSVATAQTNGKSANRYNIGGTGTAFGSTAADNFAHTGQSLMLNLNANPYAEEGVWSPPAVANPDNGDLALFPIVAICAVAALSLFILVIRRKKVK